MNRSLWMVIVVWILLVGCSFGWNYSEARKAQHEVALQTARSFFNQVVITRRWNAQHGGVYVPVTDLTPPNPYLDETMREIEISPNLKFTKINPAYMTRQVAEIAAAQEGVHFHITSLKPLRPENKASQSEFEALTAFQEGIPEVGHFVTGPDKRSLFFYMAPLVAEKSCLKCHAKQGYKEGDIRGGISVTVPFKSVIPLITLGGGHAAIGFFGIVLIFVFGNKLTRYYELLRQQSVVDALTGIPNRRSFSDTILTEFGRANREKRPLSLVMCDIDHFKLYNDTYGHEAGDACLKIVAQTIEKSLNRHGDFCARYGGEEFVLVLPDTNCEGAWHMAESVRACVQHLGIAHKASTPMPVVTLSLGVATVDENATISNEELIRAADKALYQAKAQGRNRVVVSQALATLDDHPAPSGPPGPDLS